jgi:hypothetical protein
MMEYPWAVRQLSLSAVDEWVESSAPYDGPEVWPEWKQEDDQVYQQYLDGVFKRDDGTDI